MTLQIQSQPITGPVQVAFATSPFVDCTGKRLLSLGFSTITPGATLVGAIIWDDGQGNYLGQTPLSIVASTTQQMSGTYLGLNADKSEPAYHVCGIRAFLSVTQVTPAGTIAAPTTWTYNPWASL